MKWRLLVRYDLIQKLAESELDEPSLQGMISGLTAGEDEIRRSKDTMKDLSAYDPRRWVKA